MSGGNRDEGTPPVKERAPEDWFLPLVGILFGLFGAWFIGTLQGGEYIRRQTAPHQHAQSAKDAAVAKCSGMQGGSLVECVREQIEAAEETARSEQDLTAQQQAAWGSMLGSTWGAIGLLVTVIGTILLYQQIKLTREAVQDTGRATKAMHDANEIAKQGQRPWLAIQAATFRISGVRAADRILLDLIIEIDVRNCGATPAINVSEYCSALVIPGNVRQPLRDCFSHFRAPREYMGRNVAPNELARFELTASVDVPTITGTSVPAIYVPIALIYNADANQPPFETSQAYMLGKSVQARAVRPFSTDDVLEALPIFEGRLSGAFCEYVVIGQGQMV